MKRLLFLCLSLIVAAAVADFLAGVLWIDDGPGGDRYGEQYLPPFSTFSDPGVQERFTARIATERARAAAGKSDPADMFDRELGWVHRPGPHASQYESGVINSMGARGSREYPPLPTVRPGPGFARIVCVGDSFTFGTEVEDSATWPARLEHQDPGFEAINLGVGGYGTDQALMRFRRDGAKLGGQIVVLGILHENIARNVSRLRSLHYPDTLQPVVKPRFVLEANAGPTGDAALRVLPIPYASRLEVYEAALSGELVETMSENDYWAGDDPWPPFSSIARILAARRAAARRHHWRLWEDQDGEPYRVTLAILEAFKKEAQAAGADHALVLIMPTEGDLKRFRTDRPAWFERFTADLDARGIEHLDASRSLLAAPGEIRLYGKGHFSPEANDIVANAVLGWLRLDPVFR